MNKIATKQYVASLTGNSVTDSDKCATKTWITTTYPNVTITGNYAANQLITEEDLSVNLSVEIVKMTTQSSSISIIGTSDYPVQIDWGDGQTEKSILEPNVNIRHTYSDGYSKHEITFTSRENSLIKLNVARNELIALEIKKSADLNYLYCANNHIRHLDIKECSGLVEFYCASNDLERLDVSGFNKLRMLNCGNNHISDLLLNGNTALSVIDSPNNLLQSLDLTPATALSYLNCAMNPFINTIELDGMVNTLPDRTGQTPGRLILGSEIIPPSQIMITLNNKNWKIS